MRLRRWLILHTPALSWRCQRHTSLCGTRQQQRESGGERAGRLLTSHSILVKYSASGYICHICTKSGNLFVFMVLNLCQAFS